jgi:hypothetical protein
MSDPRYEAIGDPDVKLIEECAELIQAICKARRFGWDNHHPEKSPEHTNAHAVVEEMWDVAKRCRELRATLVKQGLLDNEHQSRSGGLSVVDLPGGGIRVETPFGHVIIEASLRAGVTVAPATDCVAEPVGFSADQYYVILRKKEKKRDRTGK